MGSVVHLEPLSGVHLVRAEHLPDVVVQHLGCGAGKGGEADSAEPLEIVGEGQAEGRCALPDLEGRERVNVEVRQLVLHRGADLRVRLPGKGGMDTALEADLNRAPVPGLPCPADDLADRDDVGGPPEVCGELPFGESAEAAAEVADVRVVDVSGDHVRDGVAADLLSQLVGGAKHGA